MTQRVSRGSIRQLALLLGVLVGLSGLSHAYGESLSLSGDWSTDLTLIPSGALLLGDFSSSVVLYLKLGPLTLRSTSGFSEYGYGNQGFHARLDTSVVETALDVGFRLFPAEFIKFSSVTEVTIPAWLTGVPMDVELAWSYESNAWSLETELSAYSGAFDVSTDTYFSFTDTCTLLYESTHVYLSGVTFGCLELGASLKTSRDEGLEFLGVSTSHSPDNALLSWSVDIELEGVDDLYVEVSPSLNVWAADVTFSLDVGTGGGTGLIIEGLRVESLHTSCRLGTTTLSYSHYTESGKTSLSLKASPLSCKVAFKHPGGIFELHDVSIELSPLYLARASLDVGFEWGVTAGTEFTVTLDVPF